MRVCLDVKIGQHVYVHCNGGRGRSTICVLAYLIKHQQMTPLAAFNQCKDQRHIASLTAFCGIRPQWRCVTQYEKRIRASTSSNKLNSSSNNTAKDKGMVASPKSNKIYPAGSPDKGSEKVEMTPLKSSKV